MRISGRVLRPSNLAERRLMLSMGVHSIRIPRNQNPYVVARRLARAARCDTEDHRFLRSLIEAERREPRPSPEGDETSHSELCSQAS